MSVNKELPHLLVLPEDDADRQIANGFRLEIDWSRQRRIQVLPPAGGWSHVLDAFESDHIPQMDRYVNRYMVLVIDFDEEENRLARAKASIPARLSDRVFVLGPWDEPQALKRELGPCEDIGTNLARDCRDDTDLTWSHGQLKHNAGELARLRRRVRKILF